MTKEELEELEKIDIEIGRKLNARLSMQESLTKRELFAAMAMQGMLSCAECSLGFAAIMNSSVVCADALIKELEKKEERK